MGMVNMLKENQKSEANNKQHRTGKPVTQIATQLRARSAIRCAGR
jgi:hypothetical protein